MKRVFTNTVWERKVGYCRAIRAGDWICVTGTAPVNDDGTTAHPGDAYGQARRCFELIGRALAQLDANLGDVVRTRIYVTDITRWEEYGRAHREVFAESPPATTMVEVSSLVDEAMLVEVEVDAYRPEKT